MSCWLIWQPVSVFTEYFCFVVFVFILTVTKNMMMMMMMMIHFFSSPVTF